MLSDIREELISQRTPEQIERLAKQVDAEARTEAYLKELREKRDTELKSKSWGEVGFSEDGLKKFIAHGYHLWLLGFVIMLSGPVIMSKYHNRYDS